MAFLLLLSSSLDADPVQNRHQNSGALKEGGHGRRKILALVKWIILISGGITMVFPFYWMVITSIKIQSEVMKIPPVLFPRRLP